MSHGSTTTKSAVGKTSIPNFRRPGHGDTITKSCMEETVLPNSIRPTYVNTPTTFMYGAKELQMPNSRIRTMAA